MKEKIESVIISALIELNDELENEELNNPTSKTTLFGGSGILDSLALVSLITDVELLISDEFGKDIILADEKAMSQRTSPFGSVSTLTRYIEILLREQN